MNWKKDEMGIFFLKMKKEKRESRYWKLEKEE